MTRDESSVFTASCNVAAAQVSYAPGATPPNTGQAFITLPPNTFPPYTPLHAEVWFGDDPNVMSTRRAAIWTGLVNGDGSVIAHPVGFFAFTILK